MRPARLLIALVLAASLLAIGGPVSADDPTRGSDPAVSEPSETGPAKSSLDQSPLLRGSALQKPKRYSPKPGVVFNSALGPKADRNRIFGKIIAAINHAPERSRIRVMSWNIMSRTAVDALLRAQARGVKVRVLMDNTNLVDIPNPGFERLKASFKRDEPAHGHQAVAPQLRQDLRPVVPRCARGGAREVLPVLQDGQGQERRHVGIGEPDGRRGHQPVERHVHLGRQPQAVQLRGPRLRRDVEGRPGRAAVRGVQHRQGRCSASRR